VVDEALGLRDGVRRGVDHEQRDEGHAAAEHRSTCPREVRQRRQGHRGACGGRQPHDEQPQQGLTVLVRKPFEGEGLVDARPRVQRAQAAEQVHPADTGRHQQGHDEHGGGGSSGASHVWRGEYERNMSR